MSDINAKVTPSLHPENVKQIDGYDDDTAPLLAGTEAAFNTAYDGIGAVWSAKDVVDQNHAWTEERRIIEVGKLAERRFEQIAKVFDSTRATLTKQIAHIEVELTAPVEAKAAAPVAREIREHVKALSTTERHTFLQHALQAGDAVTLTALLGAPSYLSGLNDDSQKLYVRMYRERMEPVKAKRLKALTAARQLIEQRGGLVFAELEKAVGASPQKVAALRKAHEAALNSLGLK